MKLGYPMRILILYSGLIVQPYSRLVIQLRTGFVIAFFSLLLKVFLGKAGLPWEGWSSLGRLVFPRYFGKQIEINNFATCVI
jgi:hypothetical protein